jgi:peptidoglycan hydrolase-like protein with peptidoglycan-binding domain
VPASIQALVQEALARRGYYAGEVDGVIGPETRNAIREFQRDNGLQVTGDINSQLVQALKLGWDKADAALLVLKATQPQAARPHWS